MKKNVVEILPVKAEVTGIPEKRILKSRYPGAVNLVWLRSDDLAAASDQ